MHDSLTSHSIPSDVHKDERQDKHTFGTFTISDVTPRGITTGTRQFMGISDCSETPAIYT